MKRRTALMENLRLFLLWPSAQISSLRRKTKIIKTSVKDQCDCFHQINGRLSLLFHLFYGFRFCPYQNVSLHPFHNVLSRTNFNFIDHQIVYWIRLRHMSVLCRDTTTMLHWHIPFKHITLLMIILCFPRFVLIDVVARAMLDKQINHA